MPFRASILHSSDYFRRDTDIPSASKSSRIFLCAIGVFSLYQSYDFQKDIDDFENSSLEATAKIIRVDRKDCDFSNPCLSFSSHRALDTLLITYSFKTHTGKSQNADFKMFFDHWRSDSRRIGDVEKIQYLEHDPTSIVAGDLAMQIREWTVYSIYAGLFGLAIIFTALFARHFRDQTY